MHPRPSLSLSLRAWKKVPPFILAIHKANIVAHAGDDQSRRCLLVWRVTGHLSCTARRLSHLTRARPGALITEPSPAPAAAAAATTTTSSTADLQHLCRGIPGRRGGGAGVVDTETNKQLMWSRGHNLLLEEARNMETASLLPSLSLVGARSFLSLARARACVRARARACVRALLFF